MQTPVSRCRDFHVQVRGVSYALGKLNRNLPEFVVMPDPRGLPYNNQGNFSSGFLPAKHTGTVIQPSSETPGSLFEPPSNDQGNHRSKRIGWFEFIEKVE